MNADIKNMSHSVRQRLMNLRKERGEGFQFLLTRFTLERFLFRLCQSIHGDKFALKGALLISAWADQPYRPTQDLDLSGFGESSPERLLKIVSEICRTKVDPDGLVFDADNISISEIRDDMDYGGQCIKMKAFLGKATIPVRIDIAFGDAITPGPVTLSFPALLDMPNAQVQSYTKETVVAEKLQAAVVLGIRNSRMKDFFDLLWLSQFFSFDGETLVKAIQATFKRRKTDLPAKRPLPLTEAFALDSAKQTQWGAFLKKNDISNMPAEFEKVISELGGFLVPPLNYASEARIFDKDWQPGGSWK
jgi:predicted nucleotidyltransferase component of viral defense system